MEESNSRSTTYGVSEEARKMLQELKEEKHIGQQADGYRLGVALALASGAEPQNIKNKKTIANVGTLDPDRELRLAVELLSDREDIENEYIEGLAEWGIRELHQLVQEHGQIPLEQLRDQLELNDR
jgi:hypothetical protein